VSRPYAIVDVDGVVADVRHRLGHLRRRPPDWDAFFEGAVDDPVLAEGVAVVRTLEPGHDIVWLTGRPEWLRGITARWLADAGLPAGELIMRPTQNWRPARTFKLNEVRRLGEQRQVAVIVDDDPSVVAKLRADGWPVMQADWLPYDRVLGRAQGGDGRTGRT
jgi:hypothetical protein